MSFLPRRVRLALALATYLVLGLTVIFAALHRSAGNTIESQAAMAQYQGDTDMGGLEFARAEKEYRRAVDLVRGSVGSREAERDSRYGEAFEGWGDALKAQGFYTEAVKKYERAIKIYERAYGPQGTPLIDPLNNLAEMHRDMGRDSLADLCAARVDSIAAFHADIMEREVARLREVKGSDGRVLAARLMSLGNLYIAQGALGRAEAAFREAYDLRNEAYGPKYYETVDAQYNRGAAAAFMGKNSVASATLDSSLVLHEGSYGKDSFYLLEDLSLLGSLALDQGKFAEADSLYGQALESLESQIGRDQYYSLKTMDKVSECKAALGRFVEAKAIKQRVYRVHCRLHGDISFPAGSDLLEIAEIEERAGSPSLARMTCREALRVLEQSVGPTHPSVTEARYYLNELDHSLEAPTGPEGPAMDRAPHNSADELPTG